MSEFSAGDPQHWLLGRPQPSRFERRLVVVAAGGVRPVVQADWRDALVEVERGEISLELSNGQCLHFAGGDVLLLYGLPVRALHNCGPDVAVLVALRRRNPPAR